MVTHQKEDIEEKGIYQPIVVSTRRKDGLSACKQIRRDIETELDRCTRVQIREAKNDRNERRPAQHALSEQNRSLHFYIPAAPPMAPMALRRGAS